MTLADTSVDLCLCCHYRDGQSSVSDFQINKYIPIYSRVFPYMLGPWHHIIGFFVFVNFDIQFHSDDIRTPYRFLGVDIGTPCRYKDTQRDEVKTPGSQYRHKNFDLLSGS